MTSSNVPGAPDDLVAAVADIYDENEAVARVLPAHYRDYGGARRFHGEAVTVQCLEDGTRIREQVRSPGEGKVLVVDGGGSLRAAILGDRLAIAALENGWRGLIIHGVVRDTAVLAGLNIGVKALGAIPRKGVFGGEGLVNVPVDLGGVICQPGDRVFADEDGVVFLPAVAPS